MHNFENLDGKSPEERRRIIDEEMNKTYREIPNLKATWVVNDRMGIYFEAEPRTEIIGMSDRSLIQSSQRLVYSPRGSKVRKIKEIIKIPKNMEYLRIGNN